MLLLARKHLAMRISSTGLLSYRRAILLRHVVCGFVCGAWTCGEEGEELLVELKEPRC